MAPLSREFTPASFIIPSCRMYFYLFHLCQEVLPLYRIRRFRTKWKHYDNINIGRSNKGKHWSIFKNHKVNRQASKPEKENNWPRVHFFCLRHVLCSSYWSCWPEAHSVEVSKAKKIYRANFEPKVILNPFTQRNSQWAIFSNFCFSFQFCLPGFLRELKVMKVTKQSRAVEHCFVILFIQCLIDRFIF